MKSTLVALAMVIPILLLAGCSSANPAANPPSGASGGPTRNPLATINTALPPLIELRHLAVLPEAHDGKTILVTASYYSGNGAQLLCDTFLESYPPQPAGNQLPLSGPMPELVLSRLQTTGPQVNAAPVTWGQISVIGIFHAAAASSAAYLEMKSVRLESGGDGKDVGG